MSKDSLARTLAVLAIFVIAVLLFVFGLGGNAFAAETGISPDDPNVPWIILGVLVVVSAIGIGTISWAGNVEKQNEQPRGDPPETEARAQSADPFDDPRHV